MEKKVSTWDAAFTMTRVRAELTAFIYFISCHSLRVFFCASLVVCWLGLVSAAICDHTRWTGVLSTWPCIHRRYDDVTFGLISLYAWSDSKMYVCLYIIRMEWDCLHAVDCVSG
jgi:hypothetical protein